VCANLHRPPEGEDAGATAVIQCVRVDAAGNYSEERAPGKPFEPIRSEGFRAHSADGRFDFDLKGGDRHSPADTPSGYLKATGTLRDAKTKKIIKRAPVKYDEHLQFLGWIGAAIALQSWVDEGPGCMLRLTDPTKDWPAFDSDHEYIGVGYCYGGITVLRPTDSVFAVVNDQGMGVAFVDESSLTVTNIDACNVSGPETDDAPLSWLAAGDAKPTVLLQACGAPKAGDVVAIDLIGQKRLSAFHPPVCEDTKR
jgi:hypothetical protein